MRKWFILLLFLSFNIFAQEVPEHMENVLKTSQEYFEIYNDKTASQIEDGVYDESEYTLFSQVDQISGFDIIFSKEDIKNLKIRMVVLISKMFDVQQIEAIINISKSPELNKKQAARFFEVALEYKSGLLNDILVAKHLSPKFLIRP